MIVGIGIDIVDIPRIEQAMKQQAFTKRILTERELAIARDASWVAGRWAAKEAAFKAIGRGLRWKDVEVLASADGAPIMSIKGFGGRVLVSITHERNTAAAVVVAEEIH